MNSYFQLTPTSILDSVEKIVEREVPGLRCTGRALALNSLENRVYDIELEDNSHVVAKFYRPNRWSFEQIQEEHEFLFALEDAEIPVIAPWCFEDGSVFTTHDNIHFAIFRKVRGRLVDELDNERLKILGRYIARIHKVGESFDSQYRLHLNTKNWLIEPLNILLQSETFLPEYKARYESLVKHLVPIADNFLNSCDHFLLHGDCHLGNSLWHKDSPFFLDFDDSMVAPAIQDIWMVVRGRGQEAEKAREVLLEGYSTFRSFPQHEMRGIEILRAMRMVQYSSWIAKRWNDPAFPQVFPLFSTPRYWEEEMNSLQEVLSLI